MRKFFCLTLAAGLLAMGSASAGEVIGLYQYSTLPALQDGLYDGDMTVYELTLHGEIGLGFANRLDGVLVAVDGAVWQVRADGKAKPAAPETRVPFAVMSPFHPETNESLPIGITLKELEGKLEEQRANPNHIQAVRVDGVFRNVKMRSYTAQPHPYAPLAKVVESQTVYTLGPIKGTLVGFRFPCYMAGLNATSYRFHFISEDRSRGGEVIDLTTGDGTLAVDDIGDFEISLPHTDSFSAADLSGKRKDDVAKVPQRIEPVPQLPIIPGSAKRR